MLTIDLIEARLKLQNEVNAVFFMDENGEIYPELQGYDASNDNIQTIEAKLKVLELAKGTGRGKRKSLTSDDIKFIFDIPPEVERYSIY